MYMKQWLFISLFSHKVQVSRAMEIERKLLRLLHGQKTRTRLSEIHAHFLRHGLHGSNLLLAHFISICSSLNKSDYAYGVFSQIQNPSILVFNAMIKCYSLLGPAMESLRFFSSMKSRGIWADEYTYAPLLKSCSSVCDLRLGECVHGEVIRTGFHRFGSIRIGLMELYASGSKMGDAKKVFDEMRDKDVVVWNVMIRGFCNVGDVDTGLNLFRQMTERTVVSWNSMISSLSQCGRDRDALEQFCEMRDQGFDPDEVTVVTVLPICARLGVTDVGKWIQSFVESNGLFHDFTSVGNALLDYHCKCGELETAVSLFKQMQRKNVVSWNTMISGSAVNGKGELGIDLFNEMINEGVITPNVATFLGVLACCSYTGRVDRGRELFALMRERFNLEPRTEHYGAMVDLLSRSGRIREAFEFLRVMPVEANAAMWGSLLSACRSHGDVELAEIAAMELVRIEPLNSGNYVLLSNLYAEEGRWEDVEKVRTLMKQKCLRKSAGQSTVAF
ncbi:PREDICTED: pentatricopeptide repeat-containing protein At1g09190 [Tarenaya hassleriana]|uniref:pentatricopeptide repeat-containing protein At1g09190 n=1 Tax=Tarenaya hassleriana TaxID=28532 RepID=UPI00053C76BE|nr:PREDICTED: pentatricopeptide repeat-containing protein At1g09190 [Tarenaya hassleriana]